MAPQKRPESPTVPTRSGRPFAVPTDEDLVERYRAGDQEALGELLRRHRRFAWAKARAYFVVGADAADVEQEALIGLYEAAIAWNPRQASFLGFAEVCVTRQVVSALKTASRRKHQPLNRYVPLPPAGSEEAAPARLAELAVADPADEVVSWASAGAVAASLDRVLTGLEAAVVRRYAAGHSYAEIAAELRRPVKAVDNALQRAKRKLSAHLADDTGS